MDGITATESFYFRFLKNLLHSWVIVAPVVGPDGLCRLQEIKNGLSHHCTVLPLIPLKKFLLPPTELLWSNQVRCSLVKPAIAIIDIAPCDLYALTYLDQAYADDPFYQERRQRLLLIGRECSPSPHCHCPPRINPPPFDLFFVGDNLWYGSDLGKKLLQEFIDTEKTNAEENLPEKYWAGQSEPLPTDLAARFLKSADHPLWAEVASRCLSCGACSAVCPTCACYDVVDAADLNGAITRQRVWDNCFFRDHGLVAGGHNFRPDRAARLRFRFEHKYIGFGEQRGISSCVGCGRCQQACPVKIDLAQVLEQLTVLEG